MWILRAHNRAHDTIQGFLENGSIKEFPWFKRNFVSTYGEKSLHIIIQAHNNTSMFMVPFVFLALWRQKHEDQWGPMASTHYLVNLRLYGQHLRSNSVGIALRLACPSTLCSYSPTHMYQYTETHKHVYSRSHPCIYNIMAFLLGHHWKSPLNALKNTYYSFIHYKQYSMPQMYSFSPLKSLWPINLLNLSFSPIFW